LALVELSTNFGTKNQIDINEIKEKGNVVGDKIQMAKSKHPKAGHDIIEHIRIKILRVGEDWVRVPFDGYLETRKRAR
jgi:hypothetical protein